MGIEEWSAKLLAERDALQAENERLRGENTLMRGICSYLNWGSRTDLQDGIVVFAGYPTPDEVAFLRDNFLRRRR